MNKSLVNNSIFNIAYQLLNILFPFISAMYVARTLMPAGTGAVAYAQNIASYFLTLVPLGVGSYGVRVIAQSHGNKREMSLHFWELFSINAVSTVLFSALYYGYIMLTPRFADDRVLFLIAGIPIVANIISIDWLYQGLEEYAYITLRSFVIKLCSLAALFLFVREREDTAAYLLITTGAVCGNQIFNILHARKLITWNVKGFSVKRHILPELILAMNILLANLYSKVDITMMGSMGNDTSVGYYSNAYKLVFMIISVCVAITAVFLPRLSYYYQTDRPQYEELIRKGIQIILLIAIPATVGIVIVAPVLIPLLFGAAFAPAARTAQLLAPMILIRGLGDLVCYQILISTGNERKQTLVYCFAAGLNIVLNLLLIPRFSQDGAAIATVCSELLVNLVLLSYTRRIVRIQAGWRNIGKILLSTALMAAAVLLVLEAAAGLPPVVQVAAGIGAGIAVFAASSVLLKNEMATLLRTFLPQRRFK